MKTRIIHIIIVFLVTFQNASAIELTYNAFCDDLDSNSETVDTVISDQPSSVDDHCSHSVSSVIVISQNMQINNLKISTNYFVNSINRHHSITMQPPIPPPIV